MHPEELKNPPLHAHHLQSNGNMVPFAGYSMPVFYTSIKEEYQATRSKAAIFDISHMTPLVLHSTEKGALLELVRFLMPREIPEWTPGKVYYNAVLNENGGIRDDVTLYSVDDQFMLIIANSVNGLKIFQYIQEWTEKKFPSIQIQMPQDYVFVALQGVAAPDIMKRILPRFNKSYADLGYYHFAMLDEDFSFYSRTGYTGEDGFEILMKKDDGIRLWEMILKDGVPPAGLGARDLLRMEMFYPLYGHELSEDYTPLESGLKFITSENGKYLGKEKIWNNPRRTLVKFLLKERGIPREKMPLLNEKKEPIGHVSSGGFSFQWNAGFGMGFIETGKKYNEVFVEIRDKILPVELLRKNPYPGTVKK